MSNVQEQVTSSSKDYVYQSTAQVTLILSLAVNSKLKLAELKLAGGLRQPLTITEAIQDDINRFNRAKQSGYLVAIRCPLGTPIYRILTDDQVEGSLRHLDEVSAIPCEIGGFGWAMEHMRLGMKLTRTSWQAEFRNHHHETFIYLNKRATYDAPQGLAGLVAKNKIHRQSHFMVSDRAGNTDDWKPTPDDCLANDWSIVT
ncbi:Thoeris anti-defense Tad2 family protein [Pseudoalteromonas galatheae]|uniref:Thoeris anti-defense Tad2 family protein n=1 Tax=Pseudoalteromonas galatheae TaxID=579562 RepID=UPI0030D3BC9E